MRASSRVPLNSKTRPLALERSLVGWPFLAAHVSIVFAFDFGMPREAVLPGNVYFHTDIEN